ncbi:hypothetical protein E4V51_24250 [Paenibacillus sp. 28ISP30-2]|nr:hypothetical protein [Paenibacillus sp. 28ISP30-2]
MENILGINIETDMHCKLFSHIPKLSSRFFTTRKPASGRCLTNDMNMIGEQGVKLSGGQRQWLVIARMFLRT